LKDGIEEEERYIVAVSTCAKDYNDGCSSQMPGLGQAGVYQTRNVVSVADAHECKACALK
jgi:hypothetical protein